MAGQAPWHHEHAPRALALHGRPEGPGGGLRAAALALGGPPRGGEPHGVLGAGGRGRLRGRPPAPTPGPVDGAARPRRRGGRARGRRGVAHARRPGGATAAPGAARARGGPSGRGLGRPEHADRRRAAARVHRLSPAPPHVGRRPSRLPPGSRLRQCGARPALARGRPDLRGRRAAAGPSPLPRPLGGRAEPGGLARRRGPAAPPGGGGGVGGGRTGLRRPCRWPCSPGGCDDGARSARSVRPARDPVDAASRRAGAGRAHAPAVPLGAGHRRGAGRRLRGGDAVRAGLSRALPRLPRLAPPRAQRGRAGRDQCREELPERRRQRGAPVPRHPRGRRLPLARIQRLPARRALRTHHRPRGGPGRAVRPRVRRPSRQPLLRRHAGLADLLRARANRPAAPARRVRRARQGGGGGRREPAAAARDARPHRGGRAGAGRGRARPADGRAGDAPGRCGGAGHRRLRQRVLPLDQCEGVQRHRHLACASPRSRLRQPGVRPVPPDLPARGRPAAGQDHAHVRVVAERRAALGADADGGRAPASGHSRSGARLLPRAPLPALRQSRAPGPRISRVQGNAGRSGAGSGRAGEPSTST